MIIPLVLLARACVMNACDCLDNMDSFRDSGKSYQISCFCDMGV
jgi:hypothetical protein